jgi:hypothetical protein
MAMVKQDIRICFAIEYYDDEAEAEARSEQVKSQGLTYVGGWHDGQPCGRERGRDITDGWNPNGKTLYAVTC